MQSTADVKTAQAQRYLVQLCKHFEHKLAVTYSDAEGTIGFPKGDCRLYADADRLRLQVLAADESDIAALEDVVARHLVRFAFREPPEIEWRRTDAPG